MRNLLEIREYNFQDGTTILLKLDRRNKTASLVEFDDFSKQYKDKKWRFTDRSQEYMNGWLNILHAMEYVVKDAQKAMYEWDEDDTNKMVAVFDAVNNEKGADNESV